MAEYEASGSDRGAADGSLPPMRGRGGTRTRREDAGRLTARQQQVLHLLERGYTNAQIAEELGISLDGAKFHVGEIIGKMQVSTRDEAVGAWRARQRRALTAVVFTGVRWGAGLAAVAALVVIVVAVRGLSAGDEPGEQSLAPAKTPAAAQSSPPDPTATALVVSCPDLPAPVTSGQITTIIDWVDFVRFDGVSYLRGGYLSGDPRSVPVSAVGTPYARVARKLDSLVHDPYYSAQDCDAGFLEAGTVLHSVQGYSPRFRLATANGELYEAYRSEGARTAGDFIDLRGQVVSVEFRSLEGSGGAVVGRITDSTEVAELVDRFLGAPFDDAVPPDDESGLEAVHVVFVLSDGTEFVRGYMPGIGWVWPGIWVPGEFDAAALAAMGGQ